MFSFLARPGVRVHGALFLVALGLGACGKHAVPAPAGAAPPAAGPDLFVNTATGSDVLITGRLSIVALEALDRTLTGDLLPGDPEVKLSDPFGEFTGPRLVPAPPGAYVALHLLFASDEVVGLLPDQTQVVIKLPRRDFRLPLARPLVLDDGPQSWVSLHHDGSIELVAGPGGRHWTPRWVAESAEVELVNSGEVRVLSFDRTRHLVDGQLVSMSDLAVVLDLHRADDLRRNGARLGVDQFFAEIRAAEIMSIRGWLDRWRNVRVFAASIDPVGLPMSSVRGEILDLDSAAGTFLLHVFEIRRDLGDLPAARPLRLTVTVGAGSTVKWAPREGAPPGLLPFSALRIGMLVGVDWDGPVADRSLTAAKVDVHSAGRLEAPTTVAGLVTAVDLGLARFVLSSSGQPAFRIGTQRYPTLTVDVDPRTLLTRRVDGIATDFTLPELQRGMQVVLVAEQIQGAHVRARLVRLQ